MEYVLREHMLTLWHIILPESSRIYILMSSLNIIGQYFHQYSTVS